MKSFFIALSLVSLSLGFWTYQNNTSHGYTSDVVVSSSPAANMAQQLLVAPCAASKAAPYRENFDTSQTFVTPHCWEQGIVATGFNSASALVTQANAFSAPNALELFNDISDTTMAITPMLQGLTTPDKQISFSAATADLGNKIYVGTVNTQSDLSSFSPIDTIVFTSTNSFTDYRIPLDLGSNYNGTHQYVAFMHSNQVAFSSVYIDNFEYTVIPNCPKPLNIVLSNLSDTSITIASTAAGTVLNYSWGPVGFNQATSSVSGGNPYTVNGLLPNTSYELYVRLDCSNSSGDSSAWAGPYSFKTNCAAYTAPYTNTFDSDTLYAPPACWKAILQGPGFKQAEVYTRANSFFSAPNHLRITHPGNFDPSDRSIMISPAFSDMQNNDKQVRFLADALYSNTPLLVGTMSDPTDPTSFHTLDSIYLTSTSSNQNVANYTEYVVEITTANGYNGTDSYIAFQASLNNTNSSTIYLDNFTYEAIPPCTPPALTSLSVSGISNTSAVAQWTGGAGLNTKVIWGAPGFTPGSAGSLGQGISTQNSFVINNLNANTSYEYYIQDSCVAGKSYYVGPISFITSCNPSTAPFYENFDGSTWTSGNGFSNDGDALDNCWSRSPQPGNRYTWGVRSGPSSGFGTGPDQDVSGNGNYVFTLGGLGVNGDTAFFYTPLIDITNLSLPYLEFYFHRFGGSVGDLSVELDTGNGQWHEILVLNNFKSTSSLSPFTLAGITLNTNSSLVQMRFKAISKGCCEGDVALDEISVKESPACPTVVNITHSNLKDTTVTIEWGTNNSAGNYEVWHGPQGFYQGSNTLPTQGTITSTTQNSLLIDTLQPDNCYQYLVRSFCGTQDTSAWQGPFIFCTSCSAFPSPYYNGFENDPNATVPGCWKELLSNLGSARINNMNPASGNQHLELYNDYYPSDLIAVSPTFNAITTGDKQVRFQARTDMVANEYVVVGTLSSNTNISSFSPLDTFMLTTNYQTFTTALTTANGYNGTDVFIGLKHGVQNSFERISIDDFYVEDIPTCIAPGGFSLIRSSDSTATVQWDTTAGTQYEVQYGLSGFTPGQGIAANVLNDSASIQLIPGNVPNHIYVRSVCPPSDSSYWVGPILASTPSVPCDDMENYALGQLDGQSTLFYSNAFFDDALIVNTQASGGNQSIYFNAIATNNVASASADLSIDSNAVYQISFDLRVPSGNNAYVLGNASNGSGGPFPNPVIAFQMKFNSSSIVEITDNSFPAPALLTSFNYQQDNWEAVDIFLDLKGDTAWVNLNGQSAGGWSYSSNGSIAKTFESIIFSAPKLLFSPDVFEFYMDEFCVNTVNLSCLTPANLQATALSCDSLEVSWVSASGGSVVAYGPAGFTPGNGTLLGINTSPLSIGNLNSNTAYDIYVADTCGTDTSAFEGPFSISTLNAPLPSIAFTQNLSYTATTAVLDVDASTSTGTDFLWVFDGTDSVTTALTSKSFTTNGTHTVDLYVTNACGTADTSFTILAGIGLAEHRIADELLFYPNPTRGIIHIQALSKSSERLDLSVWSTSGQLLLKKSNQTFDANKEILLDISKMSKGMYLLRIDRPNGPTQTVSLQKQ